MTKKPIMIDDVDVAECEHLYREIDCLAHIDFSNCCEGYEEEYGYCPNIPNCYYKQLKRKEQECDQLKAENKILKEKITISSNSDKRTLKIIQTLAEIKEIIHFNKTNRLSGGACISIEQILQKCEVLDAK